MIRRFILFCAATALIVATVGCSVNTDLSGTPVPNSRPDTRVTGQPPTILEAGFAVEFFWSGADPDGRVVGYQWKISDNGADGISPRDTLTTDPLTGAELHPWHFTTATDSTFLVLADQADFPGDEGDNKPRSFRSHTLFVRAIDDKGAVDPSPTHISFTATTLVPTVRVDYPRLGSSGFRVVPSTVNMGWVGTDPDFSLNVPTKVRFLWKEALDPSGAPIQTPGDYNQVYSEIINFDDPDWVEWQPYAPQAFDRRVSLAGNEVNHYYLFAVQVQDTAGAVSVGRGYQVEVGHVKVLEGLTFPDVMVFEPFLGSSPSSEREFVIAGGQPLNFSWTANAIDYNGKIVSYRHGWDLVDINDANDPGWAVPPGTSALNLFAVEKSFPDGLHTFTLVVTDDSGQQRIISYKLRVVPFVPPASQLELMVVDQVIDRNVQNWRDQAGVPRNDESFRNSWWHFLADGIGGVAGINWERDWFDSSSEVGYEDVVKYKVVLCYAKTNDAQTMFSQFRAVNKSDKFVWLTPYQQRGGNLFLVGGSSMESFLEVDQYMVPMVFKTREDRLTVDGITYVVGFGDRRLADDTSIERGPTMYPYSVAGISALDWTSPSTKTIYNRRQVVRFDRSVNCVGLKGLVLDTEFKSNHLIGPGVVADTILTNPEIDWHDVVDAAAGTLRLVDGTFPFRVDEFVDSKIAPRATPVTLQDCTDGPNGLCIEPMFRGIARFDYIRNYNWQHGDTGWPLSEFGVAEDLVSACGPMALTTFVGGAPEDSLNVPLGSALTNGQNFGYFSYKMVTDKPGQKADVYWGFDPYRFDQEPSRKAIRWVLQNFGLQINQ